MLQCTSEDEQETLLPQTDRATLYQERPQDFG